MTIIVIMFRKEYYRSLWCGFTYIVYLHFFFYIRTLYIYNIWYLHVCVVILWNEYNEALFGNDEKSISWYWPWPESKAKSSCSTHHSKILNEANKNVLKLTHQTLYLDHPDIFCGFHRDFSLKKMHLAAKKWWKYCPVIFHLDCRDHGNSRTKGEIPPLGATKKQLHVANGHADLCNLEHTQN